MNVRSLIASLLMLASLACATTVRAQDIALKIATIPIDAGAEVYFAQDAKSFFKKAGHIEAQIQSIPNGAAIAPRRWLLGSVGHRLLRT